MRVLKLSENNEHVVSARMVHIQKEVAFDLLALCRQDRWLRDSVLNEGKLVTQVEILGNKYDLLDEHNPDDEGLYDAIDLDTGEIIKIDFT